MGAFNSVESQDGTVVGFETLGQGPPMVLVHGTTADRSRWLPIRARLAERFTVHAVDRRGRGLSTKEGGAYHIDREAEDIAAIVNAVGPNVYLVGHSYGALCSLGAALLTDSIRAIVLYEPPASTPGHAVTPPEILERLRSVSATGDPEGLLETFFREVIHSSPADLAAMKRTPIWQARLAAAHTLVRELDSVERFAITDRLSRIAVPVRILLGTVSPPYFRPAAEAVAKRIPDAEVIPLHGQSHMAIDTDPDQVVSAIFTFAERHA
ncbi:alpha/beta fold hydrolase [Pendulispora albinea]|uniref:Alpha/beta hydrolase n=1 Tax=Pendulispora albinea TaxID=2741071 RepID=A0ABZ2M2B0_9BACT